MSSTRHADAESPFRQERYASSPEFQRGLACHLVSRRCQLLDSAEHRSLIYFLQYLSHSEGGLKQAAANIIALYPKRFATARMLEYGVEPGKVYTSEQIGEIRSLGCDERHITNVLRRKFPLRDDITEEEFFLSDINQIEDESEKKKVRIERNVLQRKQAARPNIYPAEKFLEFCRDFAEENLERAICDFCLDPEFKAPWYCPEIAQMLCDYQAHWISAQSNKQVTTEIGRKINETLDYSFQERCLALIYGGHVGKTSAAKNYCEVHAGEVRYCEVPAGTDEISFWRELAKALGISISMGVKAVQLRERIERVLETGHLMLVLDNAERLWPERNYRDAVPFRMSWVMSMVGKGMPAALVTTVHFFNAQKEIERRSGWDTGILMSRLSHAEALAETMNTRDLSAICQAILPESNEDVIEAIVLCSISTKKYLKGIEDLVKRSRFLARKDGREIVTLRDVKYAMEGSINASDNALASVLIDPRKRRGNTPMANTSLTTLRQAPPRPENLARTNGFSERDVVPVAVD